MIETDKKCRSCGHPGGNHFTDTDSLGYWAFCCHDRCECFRDYRKDEHDSDTLGEERKTVSKKGDKILELEYTIEALEDEVDLLRDTIEEKQRRIVELITENDRLTLTYEPYEPPKQPKQRFWKKWLG